MLRVMRSTAIILSVSAGLTCSSGPEPFMGSATRGQMITHFDLALEARGFAIQGDVEAFSRASSELAELDPARDLPPEIWLQLGPMRWEARQGADARTIEAAARASAEIARTCGDCHSSNDVGLGDRFTLGGPPPAGSPQRHMAGLAWASRLLWDGLVGPSDRTWYTGGEGLIELGSLPEGVSVRLDDTQVNAASERLRDLGRRATEADDATERVEILADVWSTCASCHVAVGSR
jgi:hypothetical protein